MKSTVFILHDYSPVKSALLIDRLTIRLGDRHRKDNTRATIPAERSKKSKNAHTPINFLETIVDYTSEGTVWIRSANDREQRKEKTHMIVGVFVSNQTRQTRLLIMSSLSESLSVQAGDFLASRVKECR